MSERPSTTSVRWARGSHALALLIMLCPLLVDGEASRPEMMVVVVVVMSVNRTTIRHGKRRGLFPPPPPGARSGNEYIRVSRIHCRD